MRWLLTVPSEVDIDALAAGLAELGCTLEDAEPVPLNGGEQVLSAQAPPDLQQRLANHDLPVLEASPSSDYELY